MSCESRVAFSAFLACASDESVLEVCRVDDAPCQCLYHVLYFESRPCKVSVYLLLLHCGACYVASNLSLS